MVSHWSDPRSRGTHIHTELHRYHHWDNDLLTSGFALKYAPFLSLSFHLSNHPTKHPSSLNQGIPDPNLKNNPVPAHNQTKQNSPLLIKIVGKKIFLWLIKTERKGDFREVSIRLLFMFRSRPRSGYESPLQSYPESRYPEYIHSFEYSASLSTGWPRNYRKFVL